MEIKIESVNKDNSHSWVRRPHRLITLVTDLSNNKENDNNEQETSEMQFDNFALKTNVLAFASRSKAQGKPRRPSTACSSTRTVSIRERKWNDIELGAQHDQAYPWAKRLNTLLRHGEFPREEDVANEFWRLKIIFGKILTTHSIGLMRCGRVQWQKAEATRKDFNTLLICQDKKIFTSELFKVIQDAIPLILHYRTMLLIPNDCVEYTYHIGCAINLHSITNSGLIPRRTSFGQEKTDGILSACECYG